VEIGIELPFITIVAAMVIFKIAMPAWFVLQEGIHTIDQESYLVEVTDIVVIISECAEAV